MKALVILAALSVAVSASVPKAPVLCVDVPEVESFLCPGSDTRRYFMERAGCEEPKLLFNACQDPPAEDPANLAPAPSIDHAFDEHSPDGPSEGPAGAVTVDKRDP